MIREVQNCYESKHEWESYVKNLNLPEEEAKRFPDLHVNILPKCDWLIPVNLEIKPSDDILSIQYTYESFFSSKLKNTNKNLEWVYFFGRVEAKFKSINTYYYVVCKPYQYFVLKLFEDREFLSFAAIKKMLMIKADAHLVSILKSFVSFSILEILTVFARILIFLVDDQEEEAFVAEG